MMAPTPFATTEHLTLRGYRESDLDRMLELWNDPRTQRTINNGYIAPMTHKEARQVLFGHVEKALVHVIMEGKEVDLGVGETLALKGAEKDEDKWVGHCWLSMPSPKNRDASLAIALLPRWWGRGLGTEVVTWIVDYGFEILGLHRVSLSVLDGNERAISLYKTVGFKEEGRQRRANWIEGQWRDYITMGILDDEWAANRAQGGKDGCMWPAWDTPPRTGIE